MSDGREASRLLKSNANRNERSRSEARADEAPERTPGVREDAGSAGDETMARDAGSRRFP
jgi:hypothetical protein